MTPIEKCCRAICVARKINADALVCPMMPDYVPALPLINGFYIPDSQFIMPAWKYFEEYVKIILVTLANDKDLDDFDDSEIFKEFIGLINPQEEATH